eukprot:scaffold2911_cov414-Prasinococcus_capsulatus_cf.AAC.28
MVTLGRGGDSRRAGCGAALRIAGGARIAVLCLMVWSDWLHRDYDSSSASLAPLPCLQASLGENRPVEPPLWPRVARGVRSLCTWDCVHFVDIAQCGYQYEHQHAFYPLLPLVRSPTYAGYSMLAGCGSGGHGCLRVTLVCLAVRSACGMLAKRCLPS